MKEIKLIRHAPGAPGLRFWGLGPRMLPSKGLWKLCQLLKEHAFWAEDRSEPQIRQLLAGSNVVITVWQGMRLVGFGRATSDGIYRAVLWDVVVADDVQGIGLGRKVVEGLLSSKKLRNVEKIYLMTTNSSDFYLQVGFRICEEQELLLNKK